MYWSFIKQNGQIQTSNIIIKAEKNNGNKDGKVFYKSMNIDMSGRTMEKLTDRVDIRLINNETTKKTIWNWRQYQVS